MPFKDPALLSLLVYKPFNVIMNSSYFLKKNLKSIAVIIFTFDFTYRVPEIDLTFARK